MRTIAFTGGGTGGHIYPGLAVIEYLQKKLTGQEYRIIWIGSNRGRDRDIIEGFCKASESQPPFPVPCSPIPFYGVPSGKLRRYFSLKTIPDTFKVLAGFFAARRILKKQKVDILFSKGGFVSVPPCAAAASLGIPVFTHESDFSTGLATRLNLRYVKKTKGKVFTAYPETIKFLPDAIKEIAIVSGNPVRFAFRNANPEKGRDFLGLEREEKILLVLGGSQGAKEINSLIKNSLETLINYYTVVHQYGPAMDWDAPKTQNYIPLPYINEEMPHVLAAAELVIGRSGAGTVWECAAAGKPMILVPLRGSGTRGDQVENAAFFERGGAALVLSENDVVPQKLTVLVKDLSADTTRLQNMEACARKIGSLDGAAIIGDSIIGFINEYSNN